MKINYVVGDATAPVGTGSKMIVHCCNDIGGWGHGFVMALSKRWKHVESAYLYWAVQSGPVRMNKTAEKSLNAEIGDHKYGMSGKFELGQIQWVHAEDNTYVVNLIGQHRCGNLTIAGIEVPPVDYRSIREGFARVLELHQKAKGGFSLHLPRLGCGLAGGKWSEILKILKEVFKGVDIKITVYDFAPGAYLLDSNKEFCSEIEGKLIAAIETKPAPKHIVYEGGLFEYRYSVPYPGAVKADRVHYELLQDFSGDRR